MAENKKWSRANIIKLIELRNSVEWHDKFTKMNGKARQISLLWNEISKELGNEFSGLETKTQYNYLLNQFKKHNLIAKRSGEGAITWPFYAPLKEHLIKNPTVTPVCLLDNGVVVQNENLDGESSCEATLITESTVITDAEKPRIAKTNFNERLVQSLDTKNKILETILNQKRDIETELKSEVQLLKNQVQCINSKIDSLIGSILNFLNKNE